MYETPEELDRLQELLDSSADSAGDHMRGIITSERRLNAAELDRAPDRHGATRPRNCDRRWATTRRACRRVPHSREAYFSSARQSVRMRHLSARPAVSASHLPSEALAVTVHGSAEQFEISDPRHPGLRNAMLDHYLPLQGPAFEEWLDSEDILAARIDAHKMFTFHLD